MFSILNMQHSNVIRLLIFLNWLRTLSVGVDLGEESYAEFCYVDKSCGPSSEKWGGQCKTGSRQTPIDLPPLSIFQRVQLDFNGSYISDKFWITDNGHTIRVTLAPDQQSNATMYGYELNPAYNLAEIHFHWGKNASTGSEHSVNNKFYAMEAHLVHFSSNYTDIAMAVASRNPAALAVLGVFIAEGKEWNYNQGFDIIASNIPKSRNNATLVEKKINLLSFLPQTLQRFYRYYGSLTTPDCDEVVSWTVVRNPIHVRPTTIRMFRNLKDIGPNYRPIQKRGNRPVRYLAKR